VAVSLSLTFLLLSSSPPARRHAQSRGSSLKWYPFNPRVCGPRIFHHDSPIASLHPFFSRYVLFSPHLKQCDQPRTKFVRRCFSVRLIRVFRTPGRSPVRSRLSVTFLLTLAGRGTSLFVHGLLPVHALLWRTTPQRSFLTR